MAILTEPAKMSCKISQSGSIFRYGILERLYFFMKIIVDILKTAEDIMS